MGVFRKYQHDEYCRLILEEKFDVEDLHYISDNDLSDSLDEFRGKDLARFQRLCLH